MPRVEHHDEYPEIAATPMEGLTESAPAPEIIQSAAALESISRAEVDVQIATAKRYPLHSAAQIHEFLRKARALVLLDRETAEKCTYSLSFGKEPVRGPSTLFAHSIASAWGNMRVQSRIVGVDETSVTVQGVAIDLESNYAISADARKSIVDRNGNRYKPDLITRTVMGVSSIARRNCILSVIPRTLWIPLWKETTQFARDADKRPLAEQREAALAYFAKRGVNAARVFAALDKSGIEDLDQEDIMTLRGIRTALEENETTLEEAFPLPGNVRASREMPNLADMLEASKKAKKEQEANGGKP